MRFVFGDAWRSKNELNPEMLTAWDEAATRPDCTRRKLVANLPYVIATPLISNLLIARDDIERMVVMVQWEIAERLRAVVGHEGLQRALGAGAERRGRGGGAEGAADELLPAAEGRFGDRHDHAEPGEAGEGRRRAASSARSSAICTSTAGRTCGRRSPAGRPGGKDKTEVDAKLAELGIDGTLRSEALDIEQHLRLCAAFAQ